MRLSLVAIFGSLFLVGLWEFWRPRRRRDFPALRRRVANIGFWIMNLLLAGFFLPSAASVRSYVAARSALALPSWPLADFPLSWLVGFFTLDLLRYLVHRCEHAVPLLWRFHAMHHSDPDVDVTTSVRHHPIEYLLASTIYWLAVIVLDVPAIVVLTHGLAVFATAAVQHGNIRLHERVERWLLPVLVTPDMHRIHHSIEFTLASVNYGAVLSVWDRLFGSYTNVSRPQHDLIVFGVRGLPRRDCLQPSAMMLTPWRIAQLRAPGGPG